MLILFGLTVLLFGTYLGHVVFALLALLDTVLYGDDRVEEIKRIYKNKKVASDILSSDLRRLRNKNN